MTPRIQMRLCTDVYSPSSQVNILDPPREVKQYHIVTSACRGTSLSCLGVCILDPGLCLYLYIDWVFSRVFSNQSLTKSDSVTARVFCWERCIYTPARPPPPRCQKHGQLSRVAKYQEREELTCSAECCGYHKRR